MSVTFGSLGADTAANLTNSRLDTLLQKIPTCKFVGRYLNRLENYHDKLTSSEVSRICNKGLEIFSYYETKDDTGHKHYIITNSATHGATDAADAISLAKAISQPANTPIYLAIDFDFLSTDTSTYNAVIAYLQAAYEKFKTSDYCLGVYGSGLLCHRIDRDYSSWDAYLCLSDTPGWQDPDMFANWNIRQYGQGLSSNNLGDFSIDQCETNMLLPGSWKL